MFKILFVAVFLLMINLTLKAQNGLPRADQLARDAGDITFDPQTDNANFYLCHQDYIVQYYNYGTSYSGGSKAIRNFILGRYHFKKAYTGCTGFITIRFVINCRGATDRFRLLQINNAYQKVIFNKDLTGQLLKLCKSLHHWVPGKDLKGNIYDSYYYLNFQIWKGHIKIIMP